MSTQEQPTPQVFAAIAATVYTVFGERASIADVRTAQTNSTFDMQMISWSLEGRRQIHHARKVR